MASTFAPTTVEAAAEQVAEGLRMLNRLVGDPRGARRLLRLLGWELPPGVRDLGLAGLDLTEVIDRLDAVRAVRLSGTDEQIADAYAALVVSVARTLAHLRAAAKGFAATPGYLEQTGIVDEFFPRLLDLLVMQSVGALAPAAFAVGQLCGIFALEPHTADPEIFQSTHLRHVVHWDRFGTLLTDPARLLREVYGWGTADFAADALIINIANVIAFAGVSTRTRPLTRRAEERLAGRPVPEAATDPARQLLVSLAKGLGLDSLDVGVALYPIRSTTAGGADAGLGISPFVQGTSEVRFPVAEQVSFTVESSIDVQGGVALVLQPGRGMDLRTGFDTLPSGASAPAATVMGFLRLDAEPGTPIVLLSAPGSARLEVAALSVGAGVHAGEPTVEVAVIGGHLDIDPSGGDGFIGSVLAGARLTADFDVRAAFSPGTGLRFHGSGGLEIQIPVHERVGPVEVTAVHIASRITGPGIPLELSAGFTVRLGPVQANVDRLGVLTELSFPEEGGNLGPAQLDVGFKPPTGAGLVVDAGVVTGGGFLFFDPASGEYAGALELEFAGLLALKGIGLISTRTPDGSRGFSLLVILTGEFPEPGLQLGFGFRLLAVGGLLGLNRTVRIQALMDGVRTGAIESVMFPRDVIANAPRILSDLRAFFPPERDRFLIGPMVKLAWGTPTLITASVAVIIEIPGDITFVGVLKVALPTEAAPLLLLQVNFAGVVEPDQQRLYFSAALFESRILHLTLDGDMGVLAAWGDDPDLVLTVGGFHPSYTPPPLPFPTPRRVSIDILNESNARIRVSGYFAVTSNTAQFGAHAEIYFKFSAFRVEGHVGFDALFQLSPFAFAVQVTASVSLKAFGVGCFSINLRFALEGPTPWRAHGRGSISLFFFDISADFDVTWGRHRDTLLPPIRVLPILAAEFADPRNWQTRAPATRPLVTLRPVPGGEDDLVLHPMGTLFVRQRAVPLDLELDRIGAQRPSDVDRVTVHVIGGTLTKRADAEELFAPAQFQDMDDADKLSRPAFQRQHAGLELAPGGAALGSVRAVRRSARYEEIVIDTAGRRRTGRFVDFAAGLFRHFLRGNSTSRSPLAQAQRSLKQPFADTIRVTGDTFTVARTRDNTAAAPPFVSESAAREFLAGRLAQDPGLAGTLHVIPGAEVLG